MCPDNKQSIKSHMDKLPINKTIGVVLVDNIPAQTTDSQLSDFFSEINDISSIQYIRGECSANRSCWINVTNPAETIKKINISTIAGEQPRARLMGYLFSTWSLFFLGVTLVAGQCELLMMTSCTTQSMLLTACTENIRALQFKHRAIILSVPTGQF